MSEDLIVLLFFGGFIVFIALCFGIGVFGGWVAEQIKARQERPQLEAQAATKRVDAERKLEEARIRRFELELGLTPNDRQIAPSLGDGNGENRIQ